MANAISNLDDTIDSRDVIARIEELEAEQQALGEEIVLAEQSEDDADALEAAQKDLEDFNNSEEGHELIALEALAEQGEQYASDWQHGAQLIHEDYFKTAMDEMIKECYTLPKDLPGWMTITYDYDALKQDYTEIDFNGQTYYVR